MADGENKTQDYYNKAKKAIKEANSALRRS